MRKENS